MSELKIGDKVFNLRTAWGEEYYEVDTIVRATATQIILKSGVKLRRGADNQGRCRVVGNPYRYYEKLTPEIALKIQAVRMKQKIDYWFSNQKFTADQKKAIYELFGPKQEGAEA